MGCIESYLNFIDLLLKITKEKNWIKKQHCRLIIITLHSVRIANSKPHNPDN